jgi:hypothetical protein
MTIAIENIQKEIGLIREDLDYIKNVLAEDFELSEHAKKALKEARETQQSKYVNLE